MVFCCSLLVAAAVLQCSLMQCSLLFCYVQSFAHILFSGAAELVEQSAVELLLLQTAVLMELLLQSVLLELLLLLEQSSEPPGSSPAIISGPSQTVAGVTRRGLQPWPKSDPDGGSITSISHGRRSRLVQVFRSTGVGRYSGDQALLGSIVVGCRSQSGCHRSCPHLLDYEDELSEVLESVVSSKQEPETLSNIPASTDVGLKQVQNRLDYTAAAAHDHGGLMLQFRVASVVVA
ncbi:hypothetical protein RHGRI_029417 [Rhododendron griersonianum]|uniref:Uncharacterized protein n=1 Tax=Rhododendron griersonianum TaxID=479676 RepID=A0AAV6IJD7_9ERIC|nr:hypothetical protein RHGRI_029417 [Rhododendron griersonianum]